MEAHGKEGADSSSESKFVPEPKLEPISLHSAFASVYYIRGSK